MVSKVTILDEIEKQLKKEAKEINNPQLHKQLRNQKYGVFPAKSFRLYDFEKVLEITKKARLLARTLVIANKEIKYMDTDSKVMEETK